MAYLTTSFGRRLVMVFGLALAGVGCGGSGGGTGGAGGAGAKAGAGGAAGGAAPLCVPGASVSCACSNGATGAQVCNSVGSGYGACSCTSTGAGGGAGSGTVTGAGGSAGAGGAGAGGAAGGGAGTGGAAGGGGGSGGASAGHGGAGAGGAAGSGQSITPFTGSYTCTDFATSSTCAAFDPGTVVKFSGTTSGTTAIAYPLDHALFPSNLGPIQFQMTASGSAARVSFQTVQSTNVSVTYYGACESAPGSGCSITIPLALTQMLIPASQLEDIQITARVLAGDTPTADSLPVKVAWTASSLSGGLYYWTSLPKQQYCPSASMATPGSYCLLDITQTPKTGTAIYRYDLSQPSPAPQQIWTDDGGPNSNPSYQGAPQAWDSGATGGHCIGCHSISNEGNFMALGLGGSSTYNGANWALLDIQNQDLLFINPTKTGGNGCTDSNATPTNDASCYWQMFRKDQFAMETAWGPNSDAMVAMYKSKLYFNTVSLGLGSPNATIAQSGLALPTSAAALDPYQSDPFWSHDGKYLVYTSFSQPGPSSTNGNPGGLNGDLKTGGRIAIADATAESITDNARVLVDRQNNLTSYYPCVSEDSKWVVYDQSNCGGNPGGTDINYNGTAGYGTGPCDGYDDSTARLNLVSADGSTTFPLANANGTSSYDNSWPRFSPTVTGFRNQPLYWVAFSSRRPYGVQVNTNGVGMSQPQLWFAALTLSVINAVDPSFAPIWLPGQNPDQTNPAGNHTPQWVKVATVLDVP